MTLPLLPRIQHHFQDGLALEVRHVQRHGNTETHTHGFSELVLVLRGSGMHLSPAGDYPIGAGDVFVLHGNQAHGYSNTADLELVNILFRLDELAIPLLDIGALPGYHALFTLEPIFRRRDSFESRLRLTPDQQGQITELVHHLTLEYQSTAPGRRFAAVAYFMLLVASLSRDFSHTDEPAAQPLLRLGRVIGHMQQHYADPLTLDDLANIGCLSRRTLTREFRKALGCSPIDYLIRVRIERAQAFLRTAELSIHEVALAVGFSDSNYFTRQFRATVGCSPRDFRAQGGRGAR
jgi:AraC-like DNA-binding protein